MARKSNPVFPHRPKARVFKPSDRSWNVIGIDTSMSSIALCGTGFDAITNKMTKVKHHTKRWGIDDDDYFERLADSVRVTDLMFKVMMVNVPINRIFIFIEEPFPMGMARSGRVKFESGWLKQQSEVSGAVIGGLYKYGYKNIWQIGNTQWKKTIRDLGVTIAKMPEGKWDIKRAMIEHYSLPDLPDLVKAKNGSKVERPASGFGANAKPVQPEDVYDAAACMHYGIDQVRMLSLGEFPATKEDA